MSMNDHEYSSDDDGHQLLQDDFFTPEEAFMSTHQDALLECFGLLQETLRAGGHPILDRCTFSQFCAFVYRLSERVLANDRALRPTLDPVPWGLLGEDKGGAPEPSDPAFIRRVLGKESWIHVHKDALIGSYRDMMRAINPVLEYEEGYMRAFADFCFDRSSLTLGRPRPLSI
jgi:hypothetical protein